ncbi:MAG: carbon storage regulator [Campylobacterota bacterium]|nr:carbon storage regulator [Campylobacterota bacterium]
MLVLSRKKDDSIVISDNIVLKIISIEKGVVRLGIEAPSDISIYRSELLDDVKVSNIAASKEIKRENINMLSQILKK